MTRELNKKWFLLGGKILENPRKKHRCPNNNNHFLDVVITTAVKNNKMELELICQECNEKRFALFAMIEDEQ